MSRSAVPRYGVCICGNAGSVTPERIVTHLAEGDQQRIGHCHGVDAIATFEASADKVDLTLTAAAYEREWARAAWASVAPESNVLPSNASPVQRMLHARMETSEFVYQLVTRRLVRT